MAKLLASHSAIQPFNSFTINTEATTKPVFSLAVRQMLLAVTFFAVMGLCVKALPHLPVMEIVFVRCGISLALSVIWLKKAKVNWRGQAGNKFRLWGRGIAGAIALSLFFLTVQKIPLATAVVIQYLSPVFTSILAVAFLKERVRPIQWLFFLISFAGTVMLKGFDDRISWLYLGLGVLSSALSGVAYNFIRSLSGREHPLVIVLYFQFAGTLLGAVFTFFEFTMPTGWDWLLLLSVGVTAHIAQLLLTKAIQGERVAIVTSLVYVGAIYAAIFGWWLFGETLTLANIAAMALIILGVLLNIWTNKRNG